MCDRGVFRDELCVRVSVGDNLLSLGSLALAFSLTGLEGRLLITLQVAQEATEDIGVTTGTSCVLGVGLTASNSTTSEATNRLLEHVDQLKLDVMWRTYLSRSWVIWSPSAAWALAS